METCVFTHQSNQNMSPASSSGIKIFFDKV